MAFASVRHSSARCDGRTPLWDDVIDGVATLRNLNVEPNAILWASRTEQTLSKLKDAVGRYLEPPSAIADVQRLNTNQLPVDLTVGASGDCSEIHIGRWSDLLVAIRNDVGFALAGDVGGGDVAGFGSPRIRVLSERYAPDSLSVGLLTYIRADVQLAHPQAFNALTGVRP